MASTLQQDWLQTVDQYVRRFRWSRMLLHPRGCLATHTLIASGTKDPLSADMQNPSPSLRTRDDRFPWDQIERRGQCPGLFLLTLWLVGWSWWHTSRSCRTPAFNSATAAECANLPASMKVADLRSELFWVNSAIKPAEVPTHRPQTDCMWICILGCLSGTLAGRAWLRARN